MEMCIGQWCADWGKIQDALVTLASAFAGAWAAFAFERWHQQREQDARRIGAANRALYTIFNLWSIQEQFRTEIIEPHRGRADAWLNMSATTPTMYGTTTFDAGELAFLLESDSMTYASLLLEEQRFGHTMKVVESRSAVILDEAWPKLATAGIGLNDPRPADEIEGILGMAIVRKLTIMTDGLMKEVDSNLASLVKVHDALRSVMMRRYPKAKFLRMQPKSVPIDPLGGVKMK